MRSLPANKGISGEWFSIDKEWAEKVVRFSANALGVELLTTEQKDQRAREYVDYERAVISGRELYGT